MYIITFGCMLRREVQNITPIISISDRYHHKRPKPRSAKGTSSCQGLNYDIEEAVDANVENEIYRGVVSLRNADQIKTIERGA